MGIGIMTALLWACEKDRFAGIWHTSNEFQAYQSWFENQYSDILDVSISESALVRKKKSKLLIKPEWTSASRYEAEGSFDFVEVPLKTNGILATRRIGGSMEIGVTKMIIRNHKRSGRKGGFLITIIGDEGYLNDHFKKLWSISPSHIPDEFSGSILIHDLNGRFISGRKIGKGNKITGKIIEVSNPTILTRSPCIYNVTVYVIFGNQYGLTVSQEIGGQTHTYGKLVDDGITVEEGTFTVDDCDPNVDFDPIVPWDWAMGTLASPIPTPNPCDGHNMVDGSLEFAPTAIGKSESTGTYGCVRKGGPSCSNCGGNVGSFNRCHRGFDIKSDIGGNVYSMFNGKVVQTVTGWPNSPRDYNAPDLGNTVHILSEVNGVEKRFIYSHLSTVAVFPDDIIPAGQIIGTSGTSGNASGVDYPHVHLKIADPGGPGWYNPTNYVNFSYSINGNSVNISSCY